MSPAVKGRVGELGAWLMLLADWFSSSSPTDRLRLRDEGGARELGVVEVGVTARFEGGGGVREWRWLRGGGGGRRGEAGSFGARRCDCDVDTPPAEVGGVTRVGVSIGRRGSSFGSRGSMKVVVLAA